MNEASWDRLTDGIDVKFGITKHGSEKRPLEDNPNLRADVQFVEFERAGENYRLERITGPAIIDRKSFGAHRIGANVRFENVYDPAETTSKVAVLKQSGDGWDLVDLTDIGIE